MVRSKHGIRALSREDGFTLPELLTSTVVLVGLFGVMAALFSVIAHTQPRIAERSAQIQAGRAMIERLTRELREGSDVQSASASGLSFLTFVRSDQCGGSGTLPAGTPAIRCRVTYSCSAGTCTRVEGDPSGTPQGPIVTMVVGLNPSATAPVFDYTPSVTDPQHVTVTLEYPGQGGDESITLSDGASLRNVGT